MHAAKATVREVLDRLPDDCSLEEILYHLYVVQKIERGLADVDAGRVIPQVAMQQMRERWTAGRAK